MWSGGVTQFKNGTKMINNLQSPLSLFVLYVFLKEAHAGTLIWSFSPVSGAHFGGTEQATLFF